MPEIVLDLPRPPSINRTRKIDWAAMPALKAWAQAANNLTLVAWAGGKRPKPILGQFEVTIILPKTSNSADLDNIPKRVIDYARKLGLITDDGPQYMQAVHILWGDVPEGCRLIIKEKAAPG